MSRLYSGQETETAHVDTLTQSYGDQWGALDQVEEASWFIQAMASNDLIFVVLGVSLIIWFSLLFFMVRVDRKVSRLEEELKSDEEKE
jgi:hypothetical protein